MLEDPYLPGEGDRRLIQSFLLRISDVGRDDLIERETVVGFFELVSENLSLDSELAAHSILYL